MILPRIPTYVGLHADNALRSASKKSLQSRVRAATSAMALPSIFDADLRLVISRYLPFLVSHVPASIFEDIGRHADALIWLAPAQAIAAIIVEDGKRRHVYTHL